MDTVGNEFQGLVAQVAKSVNLKTFQTSVNKNVSTEGDGYIGIIEALNILNEEGNNVLSLVVKKAPTSEKLRKQFPTRQAFLREISFYNDIIPELIKFQKEYDIPKPFNNIPKYYGCISEEYKEVLLLENLKEKGFRLSNRLQPMNSNHLKLGLKVYARLHAISHAMRRLEPETFEKLTSKVRISIMAESMEKIIKVEALEDITEKFYKTTFEALEDKPKLLDALKRFLKTLSADFMTNSLTGYKDLNKDEFTVLAHTDCWSANLLFKYDGFDTDIPTDLKLIDWQTFFVSHPVHDISYFLFINAAKNDLDNYQTYLELYHQTLCDNLSAFGLNPSSFYPLELLQEQFRKHGILGFIMCNVMMHQMLSPKRTHDFEKMAEEGQDLFDMTNRDLEVSGLFKQRMGDLIEFLVDNQLL